MRKCIFIFSFFLAARLLSAANVVEEIIARVGGDIITRSDYDHEVARLHEELSRQLQGSEIDTQFAEQKKHLLDFMINQKLLEQRARDLNINVEDDINAAVVKLRQENQIPDDGALDAALRKEGSSLQELRDDFRRRIIQQRILWNYVQSKVNISEDMIKQYYEQHKSEMMTEPTTKIRRYVLADPDTDKALLKKEADSALLALRAGKEITSKDFPHLKIDESSEFHKADIDPKLAAILDATHPGAFTDPFETNFGWYILLVQERNEAQPVPFEEARGRIYNTLLQESAEKYQTSFLEDLRKHSYVVVNSNPS